MVLVSTVFFAAAYTVIGGVNSKMGSSFFLILNLIYIVFTVMDIVALATVLKSVVLFSSILTSSFKIKDFPHTLPMKLSIGFQLLCLLGGKYDDGVCFDDCVDGEVGGDEMNGKFVVYGDVSFGDHVYNYSAVFFMWKW